MKYIPFGRFEYIVKCYSYNNNNNSDSGINSINTIHVHMCKLNLPFLFMLKRESVFASQSNGTIVLISHLAKPIHFFLDVKRHSCDTLFLIHFVIFLHDFSSCYLFHSLSLPTYCCLQIDCHCSMSI